MNLLRLREIFHRVAAAPAAERERLLDEYCAGDVVLRAEVTALLAAGERAGAFLADPTMEPHTGPDNIVEREALPFPAIGAYHLVEKLGEGGYGEVFLAEQREPVRRRVALKMLKAGLDTRQVLARFEAERQTLAKMDHPGIARIFDAGTTPQGRPYFVMEFVDGVPVTEFCLLRKVSPRERLELFCEVCRAVQHAHTRGVIHRDLKPSNILVTEVDGQPRAVVIDFGIAKAMGGMDAGSTLHTGLRQLMGTPAYMSPEQAGLEGPDVDTRSDIYSLGVLLYELLTGVTPFDASHLRAAALAEVQSRLSEEIPPKPSTRVASLTAGNTQTGLHADFAAPVRLLKGDLDWIVMKALEKEPARRYASAAAFAEDVVRHLGNEPVAAGPPSALYRLRKWTKRHRAAAIASAAGLAASGVAVGGLIYGYVVSQREIAARKVQAERAESLLRLQDRLFASSNPESARGGDYTVRELLKDFSVQFRQPLGVDPEVEISLRQTVGRAYQALARGKQTQTEQVADIEKSDLQIAEDHFRAALHLAEKSSAASAVADCRYLLGAVLRDEGRYTDARPELERALTEQRKLSGPRSSAAQATRAVLADVLQRLNEAPQALAMARAALDWPDANEDAIRPLQFAAGVCMQNGDFAAAAAASMRGLDLARTADGGTEGARCILPLQTLASVRLKEGRAPEAVELAQRAADLAVKTYGDKHRVALAAMTLLKDAQAAADPRAMVLAERKALFDALRESLGDEHPDTAAGFLELVQAVLAADPESARGLVRGFVRPGAEEDGDYFDGYQQTASVLGKISLRGNLADYESIAVKSIGIVRAKLGDTDRSTMDLERLLATLHRRRSQWDQAAAAYQSIFERCVAKYGREHSRAIEAEIYLTDLWHEAKRHDRTAATLPALQQRLLALPPDAPGRGPLLNWLFLIYNADDRWSEALACGLGAIDSWQRKYPHHRHIASLMSKCGTYLKTTGRVRESRELHRKAREYAFTHMGEKEPRMWMMSAQFLASLGSAVEWRESLTLAPEWAAQAEAALPRDDKALKTVQMLARELGAQEQSFSATLAETKAAHGEAEKEHGVSSREALQALLRLAIAHRQMVDLPAARAALDRCRDGMAALADATPAERDQPVMQRAWLEHFSNAGAPPEQTEKLVRECFARLPLDKEDFTGAPLEIYSQTRAMLQDMGRADSFFKIGDDYDDRRFDMVWPAEKARALIPRGALWANLPLVLAPDEAWFSNPAWDDAQWRRGAGPFGLSAESLPAAGIVTPTFFSIRKPVLFRHVFDLPEGVKFEKLKLRLRCQDGVTLWLNGTEVARHNLSDEAAFADRKPAAAGSLLSRLVEIPATALRPGRNLLAAAVHAARERTNLKSFGFDAVLEGLSP